MDAIATKRAKPIPATIGLFFGGLWSLLGALSLPPGWRIPFATMGAAVSLLLILRLWRKQTRTGAGPALFRRSAYLIAVAFEIAAIYAFAAWAPQHGLNDQLIPVTGIIVGLHFIGLWRATSMRSYLWVAGGMVAVSTASMLAPHGLGAMNPRDAACGFGNALVLWIGASRPSAEPREKPL